MQRRPAVVGTAALTGVAAENPSVAHNFRCGRPFDCVTGDAAARVDGTVVADGSRRTSLDTAATVAAPRTGQRLVVNVAGRVEHQLAQEDERPQLRRDEQGLTTDPSQPRLDSQLLLRERRRVDERPPPEIGLRGTQTTEQIAQHPLRRVW